MQRSTESWDFRVRGTFGSTQRIDAMTYELVLFEASPIRVTLHASTTETTIQDDKIFILRGTGYPTRDEAAQQGQAWSDHVMVGFAAQRIGADFGVRTPIQGGLGEAGFAIVRQAMEAEGAGPVQLFNERSGVQVYATNPPAYFSHGHATGVGGRNVEAVLDAIRSARTANARLSDSERLAYDLYSASFTDIPSDARFLMLSMGPGDHDRPEPPPSGCAGCDRRAHANHEHF